jgi:hypothetical protein
VFSGRNFQELEEREGERINFKSRESRAGDEGGGGKGLGGKKDSWRREG